MFKGLWPGFDADDVPITSVTNGVHAPTWVAREAFELAEREAILSSFDSSQDWALVDKVPPVAIWATKRELRSRLVDDVRLRVRRSELNRGSAAAELGWVNSVLDPDVLTIGFARRVPSYKRLTLMLHDPDRLTRLLLHPERPIQLVIAGKAHPADDGGKRLIQEVVRFADDPAVRHRIVFLPNYDIAMAQPLYPGCDVWLNNPLRPYEACGTSGMKSALNGGLNLSILDGWWDEWYDGDNGWAITSADGVDDPDRRDALEAAVLYDLIEHEVAPRFYDCDGDGVPLRWIEMVRHTLKSLGPKVLATRMVRDYVRDLYSPAADGTRRISATPDRATQLAEWKRRVRAAWPEVRIEHVESGGIPDAPSQGTTLTVRVYSALGSLTPGDVDVQVVHGRVAGDDQLRDTHIVSMQQVEAYESGRHRYEAELDLEMTGQFGYTVRVLPRHELLVNPAEVGVIAWPLDVNTAEDGATG
jgi:starch phosphorylase